MSSDDFFQVVEITYRCRFEAIFAKRFSTDACLYFIENGYCSIFSNLLKNEKNSYLKKNL